MTGDSDLTHVPREQMIADGHAQLSAYSLVAAWPLLLQVGLRTSTLNSFPVLARIAGDAIGAL